MQILYGTKNFFHPALRGETKLKGGVLNGKKEGEKKGGAPRKKSSAQGEEVGKTSPINFNPALILLICFIALQRSRSLKENF